MTNPSQPKPPPVEIRLAIVMNGGVSLAVWMGGSTRELHAITVATPVATARSDEDDPDTLWAKLLGEADIDVNVDIVAGTSAGGLNGALLASSLALGAPFPAMREVWRDLPKLEREKLLRKVDGPGAGSSLLNGEYFTKEVTDLFGDLEVASDDDDSADVTCLVTATAIGGPPRSIADDFSGSQSASDHRRIYRFRRERARYEFRGRAFVPASINEFTDTDTMATAARASSSFPFAFEPVFEEPPLDKRRVINRDGPRTWLMDGGVLDNAAFEPVLDAVRARPVTGPWQRVLAYLVPSGDKVPAPPPHDHDDGDRPPMPGLPTVLGAVVGASRETDSRLDIDAIEAYRRASERATIRPENLLAEVRTSATGAPAWRDGAESLFELYVQTRKRALEVPDLTPPGSDDTPTLEALGSDEETGATDVPFIPRSIDAWENGPWDWGLGAAHRLLAWWARDLNTMPLPDADALSELGQLQAWMHAVGNLGGVRLREAEKEHPQRWDHLRAWAADPLVVKCQAEAGELVRKGAEWYARGLGATREEATALAQEHIATGLRVEVLLHATVWDRDITDYPPLKFLRMGPDVEYPMVPDAVRAVPNWGNLKLFGSTLGHFGAFADASWRMSDWTWGRLDATAHLVRLVAGQAPGIDAEAWTEAIQLAILKQEYTDRDRWQAAITEAFDGREGITNGRVLREIRGVEHKNHTLEMVFDELLTVAATTGQERPGIVGKATSHLRDALYLEDHEPAAVDKSLGEVLLGKLARPKIEGWLEGRD